MDLAMDGQGVFKARTPSTLLPFSSWVDQFGDNSGRCAFATSISNAPRLSQGPVSPAHDRRMGQSLNRASSRWRLETGPIRWNQSQFAWGLVVRKRRSQTSDDEQKTNHQVSTMAHSFLPTCSLNQFQASGFMGSPPHPRTLRLEIL
jgi:hypothetical protein